MADLARQQVAALAESQHGTAAFLIGESGLRLLEWKLTRDTAVAQRLFEVVEGNLHNPVREQLWGSPGSVLAAIAMAEHTGEARWAALVQRAVQGLWDEMEPIDAAGGTWGWVQNLYGRVETLIGAGHGFVGNVYPAVRGAAFITPELRDAFAARALAFLQATALRDADCVNWWPCVPPYSPANKPPLVQDCHGAAGIVCRLAPLPRGVADAETNLQNAKNERTDARNDLRQKQNDLRDDRFVSSQSRDALAEIVRDDHDGVVVAVLKPGTSAVLLGDREVQQRCLVRRRVGEVSGHLAAGGDGSFIVSLTCRDDHVVVHDRDGDSGLTAPAAGERGCHDDCHHDRRQQADQGGSQHRAREEVTYSAHGHHRGVSVHASCRLDAGKVRRPQ